MASQRSKRRARKRRSPGASSPPATPPRVRGVPAARSQESGPSGPASARGAYRPATPFGAYGERPASPFGGLPVSEVLILLGAVSLIVGWINGGGAPLIAGIVLCFAGVLEVTVREHFSGYRSHTILLSAFPAVLAETGLALLLGTIRHPGILLLAVVPVFSVAFPLFRKRFERARQARIADLHPR